MEEKDRDHRHHCHRDSPTPMKKAYYISRNGRLEQPHFLEIPLFPDHPLRLKEATPCPSSILGPKRVLDDVLTYEVNWRR
ncbi:protein UPSTREAM OF FLC [Cucumis melo var. makuwa]|uniref:Protein UPSTREAM OF FLC n=1 Tax=Cucumis melo var. makuwa TaxID=1194695 RepID=A0A5A7SXF0_CUCMM|nr:protein UPSTREAM OF FLC [Cucumis melo var. makuwa]